MRARNLLKKVSRLQRIQPSDSKEERALKAECERDFVSHAVERGAGGCDVDGLDFFAADAVDFGAGAEGGEEPGGLEGKLRTGEEGVPYCGDTLLALCEELLEVEHGGGLGCL